MIISDACLRKKQIHNIYNEEDIYIFFAFILLMSLKSYSKDNFDGAKWISIQEEKQKPNQWICFRKRIIINSVEDSTAMYIAADSKYWLWINGKIAIVEGSLKRGPNPKDTYCDRVNISKYLRKGENTIAVLLWYWGKDGYCHKSSGKSGLLVYMNDDKTTLVTNQSWKVSVHPSYKESGDPKPNYRLPESNVCFDASRDMEGWYLEKYDDSLWDNATELGEYPCSPWNKLHLRPIPLWNNSGKKNYEHVNKERKGDKWIYTGRLPKNITVTPYFKIKAKKGLTVDIRSDNYKGGSEYNVCAEYITKGGVQTFEMPNYINGHNIIYTFPEGVDVIDLKYNETKYDTKHLGAFKCDDEFYNVLWNKALNTMNLNMRDAIQDPDRERSQWWGDAAIILHEIFYSCDTNGYKAVKKAIYNLTDWQKEDGTLFSPVPAGSWNGELPQQMLASIGKYGFWSYFLYTKDIETVKYIYPSMKRYLSLWNIGEKGLVKHRAGGWDWADWGKNIDVALLDNAWYCLALESAINMGRLLGDTEYVDYYDSQLKIIKNAANRYFWNGEVFRSPDYKGVTDDRGNGLFLLAGIAKENQKSKIVDLLKQNANASSYMEKYILEGLLSNGFVSEGLSRMKRRYSDMVKSPLSTLWEDWVVGGAGGGSINHGWAGGPLALLPQYVAGVRPYSPGWETIMINPQLGNLKWVQCTVPVFDRVIELKIESDDKRWAVKVNNKTNKNCILALPKNRIKDSIKVNGAKLGFDGKKIEKNKMIEQMNIGGF